MTDTTNSPANTPAFSNETDLDWLEDIATDRSKRLNALLGGDPSMTFSCRSYRASHAHPCRVRRTGWRLVVTSIDLFCVAFRGEVDHCATADRNHLLTEAPFTQN